jgi:hypothetical protein
MIQIDLETDSERPNGSVADPLMPGRFNSHAADRLASAECIHEHRHIKVAEGNARHFPAKASGRGDEGLPVA